MSDLTVAKSEFKPKAFAYLRRVARGDRVCITDRGRKVADIVPHRDACAADLAAMRGLVLRYDRPLEPLGDAWEAQR